MIYRAVDEDTQWFIRPAEIAMRDSAKEAPSALTLTRQRTLRSNPKNSGTRKLRIETLLKRNLLCQIEWRKEKGSSTDKRIRNFTKKKARN